MATRRPFWRWHHWKSIGFCLYRYTYKIWNWNSKANLSYAPETMSPTDGRTDRQTDRQTVRDGRTRWIQYYLQYVNTYYKWLWWLRRWMWTYIPQTQAVKIGTGKTYKKSHKRKIQHKKLIILILTLWKLQGCVSRVCMCVCVPHGKLICFWITITWAT